MSEPELHPDIPDDFDRRADQGMWTTQYERDGEYPDAEKPRGSGGSKRTIKVPVRGSIQLQTADNDKKAQDIHSRQEEESALRAETTDAERALAKEEIEKARKLIGL